MGGAACTGKRGPAAIVGFAGLGAMLCAVVLLAAAPRPAGAQVPGAPVAPIETTSSESSAEAFQGQVATPHPITGVAAPPQHPFMAPNGRSNIHNDAYMTDVYEGGGPLGDGEEVSTLFFRECASVAFDSQGRIVTICVGLDRPYLTLLDPHTLVTLAAMPLPPRNLAAGTNPFSDFTGGGYFFLDNRERAVLPTTDRHVLEVEIAAGPEFAVTSSYDLSSAIDSNDGIVSVLPDWTGRFWFVTRSGVVGTIDRVSGTVRTLRLKGEGISNSFAVDESGGVFIVSDARLYRFDAGPSGEPKVTWSSFYPNSHVHKPGQSDAGSGTTPTLMGRGRVAITDNGRPMNVVIYRRSKRFKPTAARRRALIRRARTRKAKRLLRRRFARKRRLICVQPVLGRDTGATDQSLIATGNAVVAENNYGYSLAAVQRGGTTTAGLARVDVKANGRGCRTVWTSAEIAPSVVPKLSLASGLVYTYTKPGGDTSDPWYLTAIDFRTGKTVFRRLAGSGLGYNNNYAPVTLGPDGTGYVGMLGGLTALP